VGRLAILIAAFCLCNNASAQSGRAPLGKLDKGCGAAASAQSGRRLLGKLVKGDDQSKAPVANVDVVLDESGSHDTTQADGLFCIFLPDVLGPGVEVTVSVTVPGFAIYEPPGGKLRIPSDPARTRQEIQLLPERSPKFFSHSQLRALVERTAKESSRQPASTDPNQRPALGKSLKDWAVQHGFGVQEVQAELDRWVADVKAHTSDSYELSLAAFADKNFDEAREKALDAAAKAEAELAKAEAEGAGANAKAIRAYRLAGDAAYNDLQFDNARDAYMKALAHADRNRNAQEWAAIQGSVGNAEQNLAARSEGAAIGAHSHSAIEAYREALEVYTREQLPQDWAMTQNDLGGALCDLAGRSEGEKAAQYLAQAVDAYRNALQVYTREQLPQYWATAQNNLGVV
jgi:tetratricopeptide (TPR) repeat protein